MSRAVVLIGLALFMAACGGQQQATYRDLDRLVRDQQRGAIERPAPDTCQMAAHQDLIGVEGAAIDHASLPAGARVVCHDCMVTLDYNAQRLNVLLGPDGKVASLRCG